MVKRLPVTAEQEAIAQKLYGKSFDDLTIQQRTKLRTGARGAMSISDTVTFEQYLDDYKNMAADPNYIPKYIKPNLGSGMSAQQKRARAEAKNSIEAFEQKFQKNVNKRKRLKRAADPVKKEKDLISEENLPDYTCWITARTSNTWSHEKKLEALRKFI